MVPADMGAVAQDTRCAEDTVGASGLEEARPSLEQEGRECPLAQMPTKIASSFSYSHEGMVEGMLDIGDMSRGNSCPLPSWHMTEG